MAETNITAKKRTSKEIDFAKNNGKYEYVIINDDLEKAAKELENILTLK